MKPRLGNCNKMVYFCQILPTTLSGTVRNLEPNNGYAKFTPAANTNSKRHTDAPMATSRSLLQSDNYSDAQPESDIADQLDNDEDEDEIPPRPTSRLDFNDTPVEVEATASTRSRAGTLKWTKSLFQKIGIASSSPPEFDMDITTAITEDVDPLSLPRLPSFASDDEEFDSDSDSSSSSEDSDLELDIDSPAACDSDSPMFPTAASPKSKSMPVPLSVSVSPARYTRLPSPLSPTPRDPICYATPLRHLYGHHGRSRHALLHVKYLWGLRADEWEEHTARHYAYAGISSSSPVTATAKPLPPPPRYSPPPPRTTDLMSVSAPLPPLTIHPRRGDLSALRDPYCGHMDRCFVGMPLWTIGKTLWMYDVHMLTQGRAQVGEVVDSAEEEAEEEEAEDSEAESSSLGASESTAGFSDDSDETLVGCEVDSDDGTLEEVDLDGDDDRERGKSPLPPSCASSSPPPQPHTRRYPNAKRPPAPRWETSWYKRWEILIELVRLETDRERERAHQRMALQKSTPPPPCSPSLGVRSTPVRRFFIGDDDDEEDADDEHDEAWSEERWDEVLGHRPQPSSSKGSNVVVLSNQPFRVGAF